MKEDQLFTTLAGEYGSIWALVLIFMFSIGFLYAREYIKRKFNGVEGKINTKTRGEFSKDFSLLENNFKELKELVKDNDREIQENAREIEMLSQKFHNIELSLEKIKGKLNR